MARKHRFNVTREQFVQVVAEDPIEAAQIAMVSFAKPTSEWTLDEENAIKIDPKVVDFRVVEA